AGDDEDPEAGEDVAFDLHLSCPSRSASPYTLSSRDLCLVGPSCAVAYSGWCRSNAGLSERMRGIEWKLCRGVGQPVAHSSERPYPQGSSTVTMGAVLAVLMTLMMNGMVDMPSRNAPTVEIMFSVVKPSLAR